MCPRQTGLSGKLDGRVRDRKQARARTQVKNTPGRARARPKRSFVTDYLWESHPGASTGDTSLEEHARDVTRICLVTDWGGGGGVCASPTHLISAMTIFGLSLSLSLSQSLCHSMFVFLPVF